MPGSYGRISYRTECISEVVAIVYEAVCEFAVEHVGRLPEPCILDIMSEEHGCGYGSHSGADEEKSCDCKGGSRMEGKNVGKNLKVHYTGTFNDGTKFDSSYDRGEPLEFVCGAGMMIKGFDRAVADMEIGQIKDIHLMPEEAYGLPDPNAIFHVEISQLPGAEELEEGQQVYLQNEMGQPFPVTVVAKEAGIITFDANHEMAGKELNFKIELVEIC